MREQYLAVDKRIETRSSALHGSGVFVKSGMTIPAFTIVTYYAGEKKLYNHLNTSPPPTSRVAKNFSLITTGFCLIIRFFKSVC